jgi:hypothetical protein
MFDHEKSNHAGYMLARHNKPKKIVFHSRLLPHETCCMNQMQQSREDSQISPRKMETIPRLFRRRFIGVSTPKRNQRK